MIHDLKHILKSTISNSPSFRPQRWYHCPLPRNPTCLAWKLGVKHHTFLVDQEPCSFPLFPNGKNQWVKKKNDFVRFTIGEQYDQGDKTYNLAIVDL